MKYLLFVSLLLFSCTTIKFPDGTSVVSIIGDSQIKQKNTEITIRNSESLEKIVSGVKHYSWSGAVVSGIGSITQGAKTILTVLNKEKEKTNRLKSVRDSIIKINSSNNNKDIKINESNNQVLLAPQVE